jgi:hypothetical protein
VVLKIGVNNYLITFQENIVMSELKFVILYSKNLIMNISKKQAPRGFFDEQEALAI